MDDAGDDPEPTVAKPDELLALHGVTGELFATLRRWFEVPPTVTLDLEEVDSAVRELGDPQMVAALAMRKLQALHLLSTPGVRTTTDVVVAIVNDMERALVQAPVMRLRRRAAATDWDAELAQLGGGDPEGPAGPGQSDQRDPEADRFRHLHERLHAAAVAVVDASEGEIRILE
ncbi:hypothetical protein BH18ACT4_BH18ACT4_06700 [soil metagenome]